MSGWALASRWARRELDWRFRGLRLLVACLFLGVAALAAIGGLADAVGGELAARGATILGGDLELATSQRLATPAERAAFARVGTVSETVRMQANAVAGTRAAPIQLKAVDGAYPLTGALTLADGRRVGAPPVGQVWIAPALATRLGLASGGRLAIGGAALTVGGIIADEPDRLGEGFTLGPPAIVSMPTLKATGLVQPGSLFEAKYRLRLPPHADPAASGRRLTAAFPAGGWEVKTRDRASPGASRFVDRMGEFLTLVALAALAIAGIGVGGGVTSFLAARRGTVATLKVLGASTGDIARLYAIEIGVAALVGIGTGLVAGVLAVPLLVGLLGDVLPVTATLSVAPWPLVRAALYGGLIALAFAATPLAAAGATPAAGLLRGALAPLRPATWRARIVSLLAGGAAVALAIGTARQPMLAAGFLLAVAGALLLLAGIGRAVAALAARAPRARRPLVRLAVAALHRPGAHTTALVVALGLGLTLFVLLAGIRTSIDANIATTVPARAPALFVLDVPRDREAEFRRVVAHAVPGADVRTVPLLRGTITAYGTTRVADLKQLPEGAWALRGERGLTYADAVPDGSTVTAGRWWPRGYAGPPLVSVDERLAKALSLRIGDPLTVSLLGIERTARVTSFRRIDWDTLGFNFVLVFSPGTLRGAPHNLAATIDVPSGREEAVTAALLGPFPSSSAIEVRGVLGQVRTILGQVAAAIAAAGGVVVVAGIAVLVGAIAAAREARTYDAVVLRMLGATRGQLLAGQAIEYALLGAVVAVVAIVLGLTGAWYVVTQSFDFIWAPDYAAVGVTVAVGLGALIAIGLAGAWPIMSIRPARALRSI
ncbi:ABC transporter permease [Sphingomonas rubra]|uniref:Putative ABC transport system permease protein n=1 Tax=Sphingomonas rubra TaxID=634430 RepID=A0A1I5R8U2_9SPHN|nr:FtsX-like permease family protein [Sphingomonas rubra]SFP54767.1 putative ABC transport system permease protein [Sphingomonas rubra]